MNKAKYKGEIYNVETIYVYNEYVSLYKGLLFETRPFNAPLVDVEFLEDEQ